MRALPHKADNINAMAKKGTMGTSKFFGSFFVVYGKIMNIPAMT